jgi:F-type H+-transporting ATPase subunit b
MTSELISASTHGSEDVVAFLGAGLFREGGVDLDFDLTILVHMAAFAVLVIVLKPLLFDPLLNLFEERERRTEGAKLLARKMDERAGELLQRYEVELEAVRRTATEEREKLRAEGQRREAQILAEARAEAAKLFEQGKARIESERRARRAELVGKTQEIARDIAAQVLGREVV